MYNENIIMGIQKDETVYKGFPMKSKDRIFSIFISLLIVPFVVLTLWGGFNSGYTFSAFSFIILFSAYLFSKKVKFKVFPYICLIVALCSAGVFTYSADFTVRFFLFWLLTLTTAIWLVYLGGYNVSDENSLVSSIFVGIFGSAFGSIGKSLISVFSPEKEKKKNIGKIFVGLACAIPAVSVLILLLRSSDAAFDALINKISQWFGDITSVIFKINAGLIFFPFIISLGIGLAKNKREERKWQYNGGIDKVFTISFLSAISLVYITYILSQFAYFFSAFKGLLPNGMDHAYYARRGFFEMTIIAAINFVIISLASILTKKKENGKRSASLNILLLFIGVFTLFLIAVALAKMFLYIENFGMTRLRVLTSVFMVFLAILFMVVILRTFIKKIPVIKISIVAATLILLVIGYADVDKTIVNYNVYAFEKGFTEELDIEAIGDLGYGAVPTLYKIYKDENYPSEIRYTAREKLYEKAYEIYDVTIIDQVTTYEKREKKAGSFNLSRYKAEKILDEFLGI